MGNSFLQVPVTSRQTNFKVSNVGTFNLGEYVQVLATKNFAIPFWIDGRNDNGNLDVYFGLWSLKTLSINEIKPVTDKISVRDIYPNPVNNIFNLDFKLSANSGISINIYSADGKFLNNICDQYFSVGSYNKQISTAGLSAGEYLIVMQTDFGKVVKAFVK